MTAHGKLIRRTALPLPTVAAALVLTACGGGSGGHDMGSMSSDSSSSPSATDSAKAGAHSAADVSFSKEMIQHHRQVPAGFHGSWSADA
ncbi:hypothetical protein [Streptomyces sp. NPDC001100]